MSTETTTVELYVRSLAPRGNVDRLDEVRDALDRIGAAGAVDDYDVRIWGDAVPVDVDHPLSRRVARFREWAADRGAALLGAEERTAGTLADEGVSVLALPRLAMAEYRDGELAYVTPHERDEAVTTVEDRLAALEQGSKDRVERRVAVTSD